MVSRVVGEQPLSEVNSEQEVRSVLPHIERGPAPLGAESSGARLLLLLSLLLPHLERGPAPLRVKLDQLAAGERHAALPRLEARAVPHRLAARDQGVLLIAAHLVRVRVGFG